MSLASLPSRRAAAWSSKHRRDLWRAPQFILRQTPQHRRASYRPLLFAYHIEIPVLTIMALRSMYEKYLASGGPEALNENAALHYIPTLTTINSSPAIVRHHTAQSKVLRKKLEKIVSCIEGDDALCLDVETTIEFLSGGGAYLPGLDDNFVADRIVTFPVVSIDQLISLSPFLRC